MFVFIFKQLLVVSNYLRVVDSYMIYIPNTVAPIMKPKIFLRGHKSILYITCF